MKIVSINKFGCAYADEDQSEVVSNAILSFGHTDHRILIGTCASAEDLANLLAH